MTLDGVRGIVHRQTQMLIQCDGCGKTWDIDREPDQCSCDDDSNWQLIVDDEPQSDNPRSGNGFIIEDLCDLDD